MRYLVFAAILVVGLGFATSASAQVALLGTSDFTVSNGTLSGSGTIGGVTGDIASTVSSGDCSTSCNGTWNMMVGSAAFAGGTFTCDTAACIYIGNVAVPAAMGFAIATADTSVAKNVAAAIDNHDLWVANVTAWANMHQDVLSAMNTSVSDFISRAVNDNGTSE